MAPIENSSLSAPWHRETLVQLRTSKMKQMRNLSVQTGIYKQPRKEKVFCSFTGLESDEHDLTFHGGVDKAVHQYFPGHYEAWKSEFPDQAHNFMIGGFGENLVSDGNMNERNVCIGDVVRIGSVLLQVSLPRQPCFKLGHRFEIKGFASQTWKKSRTGWYYRVLEEGWMGVGDTIEIVERKWPDWTIERVQEYLHRNKKNLEKLLELEKIPEFGNECKRAFKGLIQQIQDENASINEVKEPETWEEFELVEKKTQTPRITSFTFAKAGAGEGDEIDPGHFVRLKLPNGLLRSYSIVSGTSHRFELGIALEEESRGGSRFLHQEMKVGDTILVGKITPSVPIPETSSNHIFIAGGIGITAFLMHAKIYDMINFNYVIHYAVRSAEEVPFRDRVGDMVAAGKMVLYDKSKGERMNISSILQNRTWNSFVYACGPQRMIDDVVRCSDEVGMDAADLHTEAFQLDASGDAFTVEVKKGGKRLRVGEEETLLKKLRAEGFEIESSCEVGNCGTCKVRVCGGRVEHRGSALSAEDKKEGSMLSCVSRGVGHLVIDF